MRSTAGFWGVLMFVVVSLAAADTLVGVYIDGEKQSFAPAARVREGKAYAPLRAASEAVGAEVKWLPAQQMAVVCKEDRCVNIKKTEGIIVGGRLLIPLRLMAEALQCQVTWDAERKAVLIRTDVPVASAPPPRKILEAMLAAYEGAQTYQSEGKYITHTLMPAMGTEMIMTMTHKSAYQVPNLWYVECRPGMAGYQSVCDGKHFYLERGVSGSVARAPAPPDMAGLRESRSGAWMDMFAESAFMETFDFTLLVEGEFDWSRVTSIETGLDRSNQWLSSLTNPRNTWALTLTMEASPPVVLWIDRQTHLLRQAASEMSGEEMMGGLMEDLGEEDTAGLEAGMLDYFRGMKLQMLGSWDVVTVDKPVPEGTFVYEPPAGVEVVEVDSIGELYSTALGGIPGGIGEPDPEGKDLAEQAPIDFTAQDLEGNSVKLSDFQGQPIVLDFWATWCPPCVRELPILEEIYGHLKDQGLLIVAVSSDRDVQEVKRYLQDHPVSFTVLWLDPRSAESERVDEEYGIVAIPRTLYISSDWIITADTTGLHPKKDIVAAIRGLGLDTGSIR